MRLIGVVFVVALFSGCSEVAPPSTQGVGEIIAPPPPRVRDDSNRIVDRTGMPLESDELVAGLTLPRGLSLRESLSSERRHVYSSRVSVAALLRYFGPRLTTMQIDREGETVTYVDAIPREARGGIVHVDVTIRPTSSEDLAQLVILERAPPRAEGAVISEDALRRHLDTLNEQRE